MQEIQDLHISGGATIPGGTFNKIHISGRGTFTEPITCLSMHVSGMSKSHHIQTGDLHVSGMLKSAEGVRASKLHVSGKATLNKDLISESVGVSGMLTCESIKAEWINVSGYLKAEGNLVAEKIEVSGRLKNNQTLNVGTLRINCGCGPTRLHDVEAEQIIVRRNKSSLTTMKVVKVMKQCFNKKTIDVFANCLEADQIKIDQVKANLVRGGDVAIGPDCEIELVEYHHTITIDQNAIVKKVKQI